tara:strand:+ start:20192 stop:20473 length:282 start_codon:yes stop_codon:yes gene_type:complete
MDVQEALETVKEHAAEKAKDVVEKVGESELLKPVKGIGVLDKIQEKVISRKLLVFGVSTLLMWYGLDSQTWGMIAMTYIGGQTAIDFAKVWRG